MNKEILINNELISTLVLENVQSWDDPRIKPEWVEQILQCRNTSGFTPTDDDVRKHLHGDVLTIGFRNETVVGFNSIKFKSPKDVWGALIPDFPLSADTGLYLAGTLIDGSAQKSGLYKKMNEERIMMGVRKDLSMVFTATQNPNVEAGIKATLDLMKSKGLIRDHSMDERLLLPGLYGRSMYEEIPRNDSISYDELDYQPGDAYALIFHLELK